jgi:hypothetical protein
VHDDGSRCIGIWAAIRENVQNLRLQGASLLGLSACITVREIHGRAKGWASTSSDTSRGRCTIESVAAGGPEQRQLQQSQQTRAAAIRCPQIRPWWLARRGCPVTRRHASQPLETSVLPECQRYPRRRLTIFPARAGPSLASSTDAARSRLHARPVLLHPLRQCSHGCSTGSVNLPHIYDLNRHLRRAVSGQRMSYLSPLRCGPACDEPAHARYGTTLELGSPLTDRPSAR